MFVALDLPAAAREAIVEWREAVVAGRRDLRPVAPDQLHITLAFLGWQPEDGADEIAATAFGAAAGHEAPVLRGAGVRPVPPRDPRLFALDLDDEDGRAGLLQAAVAEALARERVYRPERRPFWPHLTLARVKRGERRVPPLPQTAPPSDPFTAARLTLYRSTLRPQGAVYDVLAATDLG